VSRMHSRSRRIHAQDLGFFFSHLGLCRSGKLRGLLKKFISWHGVVVGSIDDIPDDMVAHEHDEVERNGKEDSQSILMIPDDVGVHGSHEQNDGKEADDVLSYGQHFRRRSKSEKADPLRLF
jgi:hypothetical protein